MQDQNGNVLQVNYDWKADPCKLGALKNAISIVPSDTDFIMLDFSKIRKARQKIEIIIKKFEKEKNYQKCLGYQNASKVGGV